MLLGKIFAHWPEFLIRIVLCRYGMSCRLKACVSHWNHLFGLIVLGAFRQSVGLPFLNSDILGNNQVYKTNFFLQCVVQDLSMRWKGDFFMYSSDIRLLIFRNSTGRRSLPFGFLCSKIGLNGKVVNLPYLCNRDNSTVMSSFRLIGVGGFWL